MRDIVIKSTVVKRELIMLLIAFGIAFSLNVYAIMAYDTPMSELITSLGFVAVLTLAFYLVIGIIRLLALGVKKITK